MNKKNLILCLIICLFICGCEKNGLKSNDNIIGEWSSSTNEFYEFLDNGEFYAKGHTSNLFIRDLDELNECVFKGKYEIVSDYIIKLYDTELLGNANCEKYYEEELYSFPDDYSQMCSNANGFCLAGYKKTSSTPYKLDNEGNKIK